MTSVKDAREYIYLLHLTRWPQRMRYLVISQHCLVVTYEITRTPLVIVRSGLPCSETESVT